MKKKVTKLVLCAFSCFSLSTIEASEGHSDCARILISAGAHVDARQIFGGSALTEAATNGHHECITVLTNARADVNNVDNEGNTPLDWAVYKGHGASVQALISANAKLRKKALDGSSLLKLAAEMGHQQICELIVEKLLYRPNKQHIMSFIALIMVLKKKNVYFQDIGPSTFRAFAHNDTIYEDNKNAFIQSPAGQEVIALPDGPIKKALLAKNGVL